MQTLSVLPEQKTFSPVVDDILRCLNVGRDQYPLFKGWNPVEQSTFLREILYGTPGVQILLAMTDTGYLHSFAVLCEDVDVHIGKTVSVVCNYSLQQQLPNLRFQRGVIRTLLDRGKALGCKFVAYTHMHKDGKGCSTRYLEVK